MDITSLQPIDLNVEEVLMKIHSQGERGVFTILHYFLLTAADSPLFQATFLLQPPFSVGGLKRSGKKDFGGF